MKGRNFQISIPRQLQMLATSTWDALIVGAGPAGGVLATILARRGWRVLLLEKSTWPRDKVCGGCLNAQAVVLLKQLGVAPEMRRATELNRCVIRRGRSQVAVNLSGGMAISRREFDDHLVRCATNAGAVFIPHVAATLLPMEAGSPARRVTLQMGPHMTIVSARLVIACDGIHGTFLRRESWSRWRIEPDSWMGIAATVDPGAYTPEPGVVAMHVGDEGYVGTVQFADGSTRIAAAMSHRRIRDAGTPAAAVAKILKLDGHESLKFSGTGLLTRRRPMVGSYRVLIAGDACGYVEPFTGQGMEWAIRNAMDVADMLPAPADPWPDDLPALYQQRYDSTIVSSQRMCRGIRYGLHRPLLAAAAIQLACRWPQLGTWAARRYL